MEPITHSHLCTDHSEWNESYYFVFFDKKNNLGGMTRLGFKPNKREGMTFLFLFLPNGSAGGFQLDQKIQDYSHSLQVGKMRHIYQQNSKWNYNFQGNIIIVNNPEDLPKVRENPGLISEIQQVKMDLIFDPINDIYEYSENMSPESLKIGKKAGDRHWEQIALINGILKIGDNKYFVDNALGQRDHTYGVRDWTGVGNWLYYVVWFNKNLAINPAVIVTENGQFSIGGFIFKDGKNIPLVEINIVDQRFREDGILPISSELKLLDAQGNEHILKAVVGSIIPIPFIDGEGNQSILVQSMGKFELDGLSGGYGSFETLRRVKKS